MLLLMWQLSAVFLLGDPAIQQQQLQQKGHQAWTYPITHNVRPRRCGHKSHGVSCSISGPCLRPRVL
jgi:hypothetical protein